MPPCQCNEPVESGTRLKQFSRAASQVLSGRVTNGMAKDLAHYCSANRCTQSSALRIALARLAKSTDDPEAQLNAVREALGLDPEAGSGEVLDAIDRLFTQVGDPSTGDSPLAEGAAPAAPKVGGGPKEEQAAMTRLSARDREAATAITDPTKRAKFVQLRLERLSKAAQLTASLARNKR